MATGESDLWEVEVPAPVMRELEELSASDRRVWASAWEAIESLKDDPFPPGFVQLRRWRDLYRIYFYKGRCRLIYRVFVRDRWIRLIRAGWRGGVYSGFARW